MSRPRTWLIAGLELIEVGAPGRYAVHTGHRYFGQVWQERRAPMRWRYEGLALGPPHGRPTGAGYRTAVEAANALVDRMKELS